MSEDEVFVTLASSGVALVAWGHWLRVGAFVARGSSALGDRVALLVAPLAGFGLLFGVLRVFASFDVRESPLYLAFYGVFGAAWVGGAASLLPLFGLSPRDDVVERRNPAAGRALAGAVLGLTLCFAGGNIGDGPGWPVVAFAATLATVGFFALWLLLDSAAGVADTVTVDRDSAAGLRLAAFFVAAGLILGRAVAGDWASATATLVDFGVQAWPALVLLVVAAIVERRLRPTPARPLADPVLHGLPAAGLYLGIAAEALVWAGRWT